MERYPLTKQDRQLIEAGLEVLKKNFDDGVYNHTVGCALLCKNGRVYQGVNCDGIHGSCAEYVTMGIAVSNGEREFDTIVAVHKDFPNQVIAPCGNCRQMLYEYCPDVKAIRAIRLVEHLNYCIILRKAGYSNEEIKNIIQEILAR